MHSISQEPIAGRPSRFGRLQLGLREELLGLPRWKKRMLQVVVDTGLLWVSLWLAFSLRLDSLSAAQPFSGHAWLFAATALVTVPILAKAGLYCAVLRYLGPPTLWRLTAALSLAGLMLSALLWLSGGGPALVPRSIIPIHALLNLALLMGVRLLARNWLQGDFVALPRQQPGGATPTAPRAHVAIYGAGTAGNLLLATLHKDKHRKVVAFLDDNPDLHGRTISGVPVHNPAQLGCLVDRLALSEVLLALPSVSRARRNIIIGRLALYPFIVRTVPGFQDLANGSLKVDELREVDITDLLGRDPVEPDVALLERCIRDQVVMVTGAGGSIGSELCRQILRNGPRVVILFEHSEYNLYSIQRELQESVRRNHLRIQIVPILNSVRDQHRLFDVMSAWNVDTVYHAAAYKHVPMVECNMAEGILNNVFGTLYSAQAALRAGVRNFVLISTDKAVRPTNTMGCTKRLAELILQALATESNPIPYSDSSGIALPNRTRYTMVRFGNVLGSSGSVVPLFRQQILAGGPITVTHPDITRFFMTIPEAASLVIQAGSMGTGGDVFVLDMGEPVKIRELAEKMVLLSGLSLRTPDHPEGDIAIEYVGLRPGEKLYEELLIGEDVSPTPHPMIMRASESRLSWEALKTVLDQLNTAITNDNYPAMRAIFTSVVDGYKPESDMVDWIHLHHTAACNKLAQAAR